MLSEGIKFYLKSLRGWDAKDIQRHYGKYSIRRIQAEVERVSGYKRDKRPVKKLPPPIPTPRGLFLGKKYTTELTFEDLSNELTDEQWKKYNRERLQGVLEIHNVFTVL